MTTETKTQSTVAAFSRIVKVLRTVSPGKRPALLDLAMREVADDCPCSKSTLAIASDPGSSGGVNSSDQGSFL